MKRILLTLIVMGLSVTAGEVQGKERLIIECSQNVPNSAYWRMYATELEEMLGFDGVMLSIEYPVTKGGTLINSDKRNMGWQVFKKEKVTPEMVAPFVEDIKAAGFKKFKHNMVLVCPYPYPHITDWFDDDWWADICNNIRIVAKATKDAGCVGIVFDSEQYGPMTRLWNWKSLVGSTIRKQSFEEYSSKVRQRGREFGKALSEGFVDCTILFYCAHLRPDPPGHVLGGIPDMCQSTAWG